MLACAEVGGAFAGAGEAATASVEDSSGPAATTLPVTADFLKKFRRVVSKAVIEGFLNGEMRAFRIGGDAGAGNETQSRAAR